MPSDPTKPLLRLVPQAEVPRPLGVPRVPQRPEAFPKERQFGAFAPKFDRLAEVLRRDEAGLELRADPTALAPERLLVFEVRGSISAFAAAIQRVPGLDLVDEEELAGDDDSAPVAYLLMPDAAALTQLVSLWRRWSDDQLRWGEGPWKDVFSLLRDIRPWGPQDRVQATDYAIIEDEIFGRRDDDLVTLEIELIFRTAARLAADGEDEVRAAVAARGGRVISTARLPDIAYHALLIDLPVYAVREILARELGGLSGLDPVMHIRPQSIASSIEVEDADAAGDAGIPGDLGDPIAALIDGVPLAAHPFLGRHIVLDDPFDLVPGTPVHGRVHGTAMASLIIHGDRNQAGAPLPRRLHVVPVLGEADAFPPRRLIIDLIYQAVLRMRDGTEATAPGVLVVNLSLGNPRRPFQGKLSPWARLLDRLAYRFGILFVVSAGNVLDVFGIPAFPDQVAFEDAAPVDRSAGALQALGDVVADRRLFSPSETVNGITVGACNDDAVSVQDRQLARANVDPFPGLRAANPSSALGPGFAKSVKPDILMPGGREHLRLAKTDGHLFVRPAASGRAAGLKVAAPPVGGIDNAEAYTGGSSAAAALATRTCHRIHDALEAAYPDFAALNSRHRAVLLKALLVHPARWPNEKAELIRSVIGPVGGHHSHIKDNIRRFLGFGFVDADDAVACAEDRATFWATGELHRDRVMAVSVPVPAVMNGQARPHSLSATLAWFTPVVPGRKTYRSVRLQIPKPEGLDRLTVTPLSGQPDANQTNRGTVYKRCWEGERAPAVGENGAIQLVVQRDPDAGPQIDEPVPFGLAVTISMPGMVGLYEEVRQRLGLAVRQRV